MQKNIKIKCSRIAADSVEIQILPFISFVTLNKVLNFSKLISCPIK